MTRLTLREIVAGALGEVGLDRALAVEPRGRARSTTWLAGERGIGIRHYQSGRKVYVVQTRMSGRIRTVTIGSAHVLTRHQAITVGRRVLAHAQVGHDPAEVRQHARTAPRMDDFLAEYWERCAPGWKASTLETMTGYRRSHIAGAFPEACVDTLEEPEIARWFAALTDRSGPAAANRCLEILRAALNKAEAWGYRSENTNPCRTIRQNRRVHRKRFLSNDEMARLGALLAEGRASDDLADRTHASAITLLLLTGCRIGEILSLEWSELRGLRLNLRDSKTGPRTVWLGQEARDVIDAVPRKAGIKRMFWNWRCKRPIRSLTHIWIEMRRKVGLDDVRLHDLRHTFASHAAMSRENLPMIGKLLGHARVASTARYAHLDDGHVLEAAEATGDLVERLMCESYA